MPETNMMEEAEKAIKQRKILKGIAGLLAVSLLLGVAVGLSPETRTVDVQVPYQEAVYKTVDKTVYVAQTETRYKTETVIKYATRYSGQLQDLGLTTTTWDIDKALSYTSEYTGKDVWGYDEYRVLVCWSTCYYYYHINSIDLKAEQVPYTDTVQTPYEVTVSVPKTTTEQVIDRYDTKYRTEYQQVTKSRFAWWLGR